MASDVKRWQDAVDDYRCGLGDECGDGACRVLNEAAHIALAAAEWEEWSSCNFAGKRTEILQAILRGEGPERKPPKGTDDG